MTIHAIASPTEAIDIQTPMCSPQLLNSKPLNLRSGPFRYGAITFLVQFSILIIMIASAGCAGGGRTTSSTQTIGSLSVNPNSVSFGNVPVGSSTPASVTL